VTRGEDRGALLEAGLDGDTTVPRVNVDHTDVAKHCAATWALTRRFGAERAKVRVVRLERVEECVARGDGGECEGRGDQGQCWH
jgi:hypothetical protein